ncbi:MAG: TIGR00730 family Rossman fold protein [Lactimicrobium sp.]|jgi:uncharacterized protein (TIGR00730 family)|uniref:LOG family protein n=1 Tax=Lactimicrobium sp. TaxID=2563780 RepID=UPI002F35D072
MKIAVYLGSSYGRQPAFKTAARELGSLIGKHHDTLIYGGASVGLMNELAQGALEQGGQVIGIMPRFMVDVGKQRNDLSQLVICETMSERRDRMKEVADGFIAMPGGPGTLDEISEVISDSRLHLLPGRIALLSLNDYYAPLKKQFDDMISNGFMEPMDNLLFAQTVQEGYDWVTGR